jgi:hypothetical protein
MEHGLVKRTTLVRFPGISPTSLAPQGARGEPVAQHVEPWAAYAKSARTLTAAMKQMGFKAR